MRSSNIAPPLLMHDPLVCSRALIPPNTRRLAPPTLAPPLGAHITSPTDSNTPGPLIAPGSPRPACAACDGEVVEPETEPRRRDANQAAEQDVEAKVAEVGEAGGADVDGGADGNEDEGEGPNGWGGVLIADGHDVFFGVSWGDGGFMLGEGHGGLLLDV